MKLIAALGPHRAPGQPAQVGVDQAEVVDRRGPVAVDIRRLDRVVKGIDRQQLTGLQCLAAEHSVQFAPTFLLASSAAQDPAIAATRLAHVDPHAVASGGHG